MSAYIASTQVAQSLRAQNNYNSPLNPQSIDNKGDDFNNALAVLMQNSATEQNKSVTPLGHSTLALKDVDFSEFSSLSPNKAIQDQKTQMDPKWQALDKAPKEDDYSILEGVGDGLIWAAKLATGGIFSFLK